MSFATFWQSVWVGWKRRWRLGVSAAFVVLGAVWTVTEVLTRVSGRANTWVSQNGATYLITAVALSVLAFLISTFEARSVSFVIPNTSNRLTFKFGDLFAEDADWLVGVNEFFDSAIGPVVSPQSIHGQIISKQYGGDELRFRTDADNALSGQVGEVVARVQGQTTRYPIGTTIALPRSARHIFLVAVARTDLATNRASSDVPTLWGALTEALRAVDNQGNGQPLALPLIGNGRSSVAVPPQHLLRLITLIIVEAIKRHGLPKDIRIMLADDCFDMIDLPELKRGWSFG